MALLCESVSGFCVLFGRLSLGSVVGSSRLEALIVLFVVVFLLLKTIVELVVLSGVVVALLMMMSFSTRRRFARLWFGRHGEYNNLYLFEILLLATP